MHCAKVLEKCAGSELQHQDTCLEAWWRLQLVSLNRQDHREVRSRLQHSKHISTQTLVAQANKDVHVPCHVHVSTARVLDESWFLITRKCLLLATELGEQSQSLRALAVGILIGFLTEQSGNGYVLQSSKLQHWSKSFILTCVIVAAH